VFWAVPVDSTKVLIWNAVIGGSLAVHGMGTKSMMFQEMQRAGVALDDITYYLC